MTTCGYVAGNSPQRPFAARKDDSSPPAPAHCQRPICNPVAEASGLTSLQTWILWAREAPDICLTESRWNSFPYCFPGLCVWICEDGVLPLIWPKLDRKFKFKSVLLRRIIQDARIALWPSDFAHLETKHSLRRPLPPTQKAPGHSQSERMIMRWPVRSWVLALELIVHTGQGRVWSTPSFTCTCTSLEYSLGNILMRWWDFSHLVQGLVDPCRFWQFLDSPGGSQESPYHSWIAHNDGVGAKYSKSAGVMKLYNCLQSNDYQGSKQIWENSA